MSFRPYLKPQEKPPFVFHLATQLISIRFARGWTQAELAARCGIPQSSLARIESGKSLPSLETLCKIAAAYETEIAVTFASFDKVKTRHGNSGFLGAKKRFIRNEKWPIERGLQG